ncbi:polyketide cyclase (plasmid) [Alcanivorax sp. N3-2A]|nr:polyketide cyclase [Alcanivorax sp. N3-2A]ASK36704.1 polyketide cyclase [Alcanivorax sp. N3-2A]
MNDDRTLSTKRTLPYPPEAIYGAFSSPDLLALWWGPEGFTNTFETFEFKPGGRWKFVMHGPDGSDYLNESRFEELVPNAKVVIRHDCAPHFTLTIELIAAGEGTHLTWSQVFDDAETARAVKARAGSANEQNLDRLTSVLDGAAGAA